MAAFRLPARPADISAERREIGYTPPLASNVCRSMSIEIIVHTGVIPALHPFDGSASKLLTEEASVVVRKGGSTERLRLDYRFCPR